MAGGVWGGQRPAPYVWHQHAANENLRITSVNYSKLYRDDLLFHEGFEFFPEVCNVAVLAEGGNALRIP